MTSKRITKGKPKPKTRMTSLETFVCFIAIIVLAGFIAYRGLDSSAVWGFLAIAIGLLFRKGLR